VAYVEHSALLLRNASISDNYCFGERGAAVVLRGRFAGAAHTAFDGVVIVRVLLLLCCCRCCLVLCFVVVVVRNTIHVLRMVFFAMILL
jgi:hypothetical protein